MSGFVSTNPEIREIGLRTSPVSWLGGVACKLPSHIGVDPTARCSGSLRNPALQSRGGDGWRSFPQFLEEALRLPEHEVRDDCRGATSPARGLLSAATELRGANSSTTFQAKCLRADGRWSRPPRSVASGKPVPTSHAEKRWMADRPAGIALFAIALPGPHTRRPDSTRA